jgi:hypothetical protein
MSNLERKERELKKVLTKMNKAYTKMEIDRWKLLLGEANELKEQIQKVKFAREIYY